MKELYYVQKNSKQDLPMNVEFKNCIRLNPTFVDIVSKMKDVIE